MITFFTNRKNNTNINMQILPYNKDDIYNMKTKKGWRIISLTKTIQLRKSLMTLIIASKRRMKITRNYLPNELIIYMCNLYLDI